MSEKSQAMRLLDIVWTGANSSARHSWDRLNHSMQACLSLAVGSGLTFAESDFADILTLYRASRWLGDPERFYALGVRVGNASAIRSFEAWRQRKPFIARGVDAGSNDDGFVHRASPRGLGRLAVGFNFTWSGERVRVTSFNDEAGTLTACSYDRAEVPPSRARVLHRYSITPTDLRAARRSE